MLLDLNPVSYSVETIVWGVDCELNEAGTEKLNECRMQKQEDRSANPAGSISMFEHSFMIKVGFEPIHRF